MELTSLRRSNPNSLTLPLDQNRAQISSMMIILMIMIMIHDEDDDSWCLIISNNFILVIITMVCSKVQWMILRVKFLQLIIHQINIKEKGAFSNLFIGPVFSRAQCLIWLFSNKSLPTHYCPHGRHARRYTGPFIPYKRKTDQSLTIKENKHNIKDKNSI